MGLNTFGAVAVTVMMLCYACEARHRTFTLVFAGACFVSSAYGWLSGTWPFGIVEALWGIIAFLKWKRLSQSNLIS
jgi:hypothetical protein